jgi:CheY-like chemotaxis protein
MLSHTIANSPAPNLGGKLGSMSNAAQPETVAHILVADDSAPLRSYFERLLGHNGYRVTTVADGEQARGRLSLGDIDAILSDIDMPGLTGIQLLQHVGASLEDPPVVLVTGNPNVDTAMQAVNGRAVAYLQKPVDEKVLLEAVSRAVRISHLAKNRRAIGELVAARETQATAKRKDEASLDNALRTLWMAFQPIVGSRNGQIFAYEALVRNEDPQLRAPPDLLRAAQTLGRSRELSRRRLRCS